MNCFCILTEVEAVKVNAQYTVGCCCARPYNIVVLIIQCEACTSKCLTILVNLMEDEARLGHIIGITEVHDIAVGECHSIVFCIDLDFCNVTCFAIYSRNSRVSADRVAAFLNLQSRSIYCLCSPDIWITQCASSTDCIVNCEYFIANTCNFEGIRQCINTSESLCHNDIVGIRSIDIVECHGILCRICSDSQRVARTIGPICS